MFESGGVGHAPKGQAPVDTIHPLRVLSDADAKGFEESWS